MRIVHISDLHWRCLKYHSEYRSVFENLYKKIDELKPDLVINTGDTVHQKTNMSPELVDVVSWMHREIARRAELDEILGNHDMNLMNSNRQDAITPIVESINDPKIRLHKKSGLAWSRKFDCGRVNLWVFGIGDAENYPQPKDWGAYPDDINIGVFHGSISRCVTDSNWRMTHTEHDVGIFDGLDYVLMGDIHKQQFMDAQKRIGYAGSLIQQNFGEDVEKGFLVWDIAGKDKHEVFPVFLDGSRKFYTIRLGEDMRLPSLDIEEGSRIRVSPARALSLAEQKDVRRRVKAKYKPHDVIVLSSANIGSQVHKIGKKAVEIENLRQLGVQERLIQNFLKDQNLPSRIMDKILEINRKYQISFDQQDETTRDVSWKINSLTWSNLFNYGENNSIDFSNISGLTGIFAENSKGKSNFIDVIMETLFDKVTKGVSKNIFLINDNKEKASSIANITSDDKEYMIERCIERIKYGQKKDEEKEWGKTSLNFNVLDEHGVLESLNGDLRPETERNIRQRLGTFEDFMLTGLTSQWNTMDIISCKETDRKKILYKFLDLDIFEQKGLMARNDSKEWYTKLSNLEDSGVQESAEKYRKREQELTEQLTKEKELLESLHVEVKQLDTEILELSSQKVKVDCDVDPVSARDAIEKAKKNVQVLQENITKKQAEILDYESKLLAIKDPAELAELKKSSDRYLEAKNERIKATSDRERAEQALQNSRKKLPLLKEVPCGDQFPECKFLIDAFNSKKELPNLMDDVSVTSHREEKLLEELKSLEPLSKKHTEEQRKVVERGLLESNQKNARLQLENFQLKVKGYDTARQNAEEQLLRYEKASADIKRNNELSAKIAALLSAKKHKEKQSEISQRKLNDLLQELGAQTGILEKLDEELSKLQQIRDYCTAFEQYIRAMGKDGIAYQILTQKLPLINDEINKILANAVDFGVVIEHDPEEQSIRLYLQYGDYKPRILELGGGAEKMLASIAIRTALLNISNLPKTNMFIIDEGFGRLDPKNMESVNKMFDYLRTVFEHVLVISHIDTMKDIVDNVIEITTDDEGYSHIEV